MSLASRAKPERTIASRSTSVRAKSAHTGATTEGSSVIAMLTNLIGGGK